MRYSPAFIDRLRSHFLLSEVVGKRVPIKKQGREFHGLCPFHQEKSPSFTVNDEKGFYHCFGCGAHGDAIGFIMEHDRLTYPETIELLARDAGIPLPQPTREESRKAEQEKTLVDVVEAACQWFEKQLASSSGAPARAYIERRGLKPQALTQFRIGYAPDGKAALHQHLLGLGFTQALQAQAGLIGKPPDAGGTPYDRFRARLIFPIRNPSGKVIAFGGRLIEGNSATKNLPKYLNSPETPLFKKGELLYNLDLAKRPARDGNLCIVMEGYMDVVSSAQSGIATAVATLGTAVTAEHLRLLWQLAREPVLCLDGDAAGQRAMMRAADIALPLLKPGYSLRFAVLPKGEDPDSFVRKNGKAAFEKIVTDAAQLSEMLWEHTSPSYKLSLPEGRAALEDALRQLADKIAHPGVKPHYLSYFRQLLWKNASARTRPSAGGSTLGRSTHITQMARRHHSVALEALARRLLRILLRFPPLLHRSDIEEALSRLLLSDPAMVRLRDAVLAAASMIDVEDKEHFLGHIALQAPEGFLQELLTDPMPMPGHGMETLDEAQNLWNNTLAVYELTCLEEELKELETEAVALGMDEAILQRMLELKHTIQQAHANRTFAPPEVED